MSSWKTMALSECLEPIKSNTKVQRGWSPQCLNHPVTSDDKWGVLKTTAVQMGLFDPKHNKELPDKLEPKTHLEVQRGDFLMTTTGPRNRCGVICYVKDTPTKLIFSGKILRFRVRKEVVDPRWVEHVLLSPKYQEELDSMKVGTSDSSVSIGNSQVLALQIPVPPLDEQTRIVEALDDQLSRLDKALAQIYSADLGLTNLKHAHLDSLFMGELDPFPSVPLSALGRWVTGSTPKSSNTLYQGDDVPFVTPGDVYYGDEILSVSRRISNLGADSVRRLPAPSVQVVCIGATLGKVGYSLREVTTNQQITSLLPDVNVISAPYAAWLLSSPLVQSLLWQSSSSTTVPILNKGTLEQIEVPLAPLEKQSEILSQIESQAKLSRSVLERITTATQTIGLLKRSILHRAFSGNQQEVEA